jgi:excinuclease ABC subunit A
MEEFNTQGTYEEILKCDSLTAKYLNGERKISVPKNVNIKLCRNKGARENNLQNIDVLFL